MLFTLIARRRAAASLLGRWSQSCPAHSRGDDDRKSFIASPGPAAASSGSRPHLAVTTPTPQPIARGSQIPIAPARRTVARMPARGFLPRGLSDACPPSAPHCQVTCRRLITLNVSGHWYTVSATFRPLSQGVDGFALLGVTISAVGRPRPTASVLRGGCWASY